MEVIKYFNEQCVPKEFNPHKKENEIVKIEVNYEEICTGMEEASIATDNLTVFQFYSKIQYFDKKAIKYANQHP